MTAENGYMTDTTNRKRQPKGVPVGGEFASNEHDEAGDALRANEPAPIPFEVEGGFVQEGHHLVWGEGIENPALDWAYKTNPEFKRRYLLAGNPRRMKVVGEVRVPDEPSSRLLLVEIGDGEKPIEIGVHREGDITIDERDLD